MKTPFLLLLGFPVVLAAHNVLLPQPQQVRYGSGHLPVRGLSVVLASASTPEDAFTVARLSAGLARSGGGGGTHTIRLTRTGAVDALPKDNEQPGPGSRESYHLRISPSGGEVRARSSAGLFYAAETILQLVEGSDSDAFLPEVEIDDFPSLAYRGVMFDLSHGPLPTEAEIKRQIDFLARWKGNQYYFYSELSIELKGYPLINPGGRYSQDQVRRIIAYARQRHVDVVPCLEFYGHLHDLFRIERYANLAAMPHGGDLNPRDPEMQRLVADWITQMTALFPSPWFHIGLDEPWELERAASGAGGLDPAKLYLDHLTRTAALVRSHGKRVLFWADVASGANLFEKYPQLAGQLPAGTLPVPWRYHDDPDYTRMLEPFRQAHVPQLIATGIWGWDTIVPDFHVAFANIDGYLRDGRRFGTLGLMNTNWADDAQVLYRNTQPGIAYGASAAWQRDPMDRSTFFSNYSSILYGPKAGPGIAAALQALDDAQQALGNAVGAEDMFRLWDDPFAPPVLSRVRGHVQDLRQARLKAEEAQERLQDAADRYPDSLSSFLLGARLLDYAGMKFLYAVEIADNYSKLTPSESSADLSFWLGREATDRNHSRIDDLMDLIKELRDLYQTQWEAEYTTYRLGTALGRFDAEFEYWRRFQANIWEMRRTHQQGQPLPSLDSLRH
ncbi:MAG TPA: family 20 glycosylhydrolase [Bryobacteraceae bacterium]|nr:family 20 glycosylhydrolase [Bryobacteraceae bacterium]